MSIANRLRNRNAFSSDVDGALDKPLLLVAADRIEELQDKLKWAYCKEIGADSIIGLDCCDDYRDWLKILDV